MRKEDPPVLPTRRLAGMQALRPLSGGRAAFNARVGSFEVETLFGEAFSGGPPGLQVLLAMQSVLDLYRLNQSK